MTKNVILKFDWKTPGPALALDGRGQQREKTKNLFVKIYDIIVR